MLVVWVQNLHFTFTITRQVQLKSNAKQSQKAAVLKKKPSTEQSRLKQIVVHTHSF